VEKYKEQFEEYLELMFDEEIKVDEDTESNLENIGEEVIYVEGEDEMINETFEDDEDSDDIDEENFELDDEDFEF